MIVISRKYHTVITTCAKKTSNPNKSSISNHFLLGLYNTISLAKILLSLKSAAKLLHQTAKTCQYVEKNAKKIVFDDVLIESGDRLGEGEQKNMGDFI